MDASKYNTKEYWDNIFRKELKKGLRRVDYDSWNVILGQIKDNMKVLDYGCGSNEFLAYVLKKRNIEAIGVDHSEIALKATLNRNIATFLSIEGSGLAKGYFDIITILHTIEHFQDSIGLINKLIPYLKDTGLMIISLPLNDKPWLEHYKVWKLKDIIRLLNNFNCFYRITERYIYLKNNDKIDYIAKDPLKKEAIAYIKFGG